MAATESPRGVRAVGLVVTALGYQVAWLEPDGRVSALVPEDRPIVPVTHALFVAADWRRRNIGRRLLDAVAASSQARPVAFVGPFSDAGLALVRGSSGEERLALA